MGISKNYLKNKILEVLKGLEKSVNFLGPNYTKSCEKADFNTFPKIKETGRSPKGYILYNDWEFNMVVFF